ncbi:hypothetical protein HAX54_039015 [Datura stramonium]|uniref:Uncharacterized protein n=1 Tax=Datura stramonium TaxID=4076 RepID=A0ABS8VPL2_DATST|nr:hypothetical protein [Datura stramonium]
MRAKILQLGSSSVQEAWTEKWKLMSVAILTMVSGGYGEAEVTGLNYVKELKDLDQSSVGDYSDQANAWKD